MKITTLKWIAHRKNIAPVAKSIDVVARGLVKVPGRGAHQLFQGPQIIKLLGFSTLYLGLVDDDVTLPLNETEFLVLRILSNTVMAQFNRNMMLEFSKNTEHYSTWSPLGLHRCSAFHPPKLPNVEVTFLSSILNSSLKSLTARQVHMWVMFFMSLLSLLSWLFL